MSRTLLAAVVAAAFSAPAFAQVKVEIVPPTVTFEVAPTLVVIEPGIQVVPDYGEEVFFASGHYWVRKDARWFKSRRHSGGWVHVGPKGVPYGLSRIPHGKYRHWKRHHRGDHHDDHHRHGKYRDRKDDHRDDKGKSRGRGRGKDSKKDRD